MATAVDALLVVFAALSPDEQDDAYEQMGHARALRDSAGESMTARCVRSLCRVAEHVGRSPAVNEYKQASTELRAAGEDIETFARLYKHFEHNWIRVREALELADTTTARRIDARWSSMAGCSPV